MLYILLLLWQFPQTLLSLVLMLILKAKFSHKICKSSIYLVNGIDGMSLGEFIFINPKCKEGILLRHEYGHTIQSRILGPLYLIIIFIPSFIWYLMDQENIEDYYKFYTESSANCLMGIGMKRRKL